jgi:hypothetical protein
MQQFSRFRGEADIQQAALTTGADRFALDAVGDTTKNRLTHCVRCTSSWIAGS